MVSVLDRGAALLPLRVGQGYGVRRDCRHRDQKYAGAVMLHPLAMESLPKAEFVPQAVIGQPISSIGEAVRLPLLKGHDELDEFEDWRCCWTTASRSPSCITEGTRRARVRCICRPRWTRGASAR